MRINAEAKAATRTRILDAARQLFAKQGFEATTTRDIAQGAGIATGTLFNYFPTKEAIVACQATEAMEAAAADFDRRSSDASSFEEDLFAHVAAGMRRLKPLRKQLPSLLQTSLSPLVDSPRGDPGCSEAGSLRVTHLETVTQLAEKHGMDELSPVALQLCWTLYVGILAYWANDNSPKQEDTLALLDQSMRMFVGWLNSATEQPQTHLQKKQGS